MRKPLLFLMSVFMSACQADDDVRLTDETPLKISRNAANAIAADMVSRLAEKIGPASGTAISMEKDKSDYAVALEAAFKGWGYEVSSDGKALRDVTQIKLGYSIESFDGQLLAGLTTPSIALNRVYAATPDGATPASPLSIMQRN